MATVEGPHVDAGRASRCRYHHSVTGSSGVSLSGDSDDQSWHSPLEIEGVLDSQRDSSGSDCLFKDDLESGVQELKAHLGKIERDCRICHLGVEGGTEAGVLAELGCACKGDLGAAHKQCAETWFRMKGNTHDDIDGNPWNNRTRFEILPSRTCEICGATALNVASVQRNEANNVTVSASALAAPVILVENGTIWHGRRIMNFLLACMVFGFVISWLFHFKILT